VPTGSSSERGAALLYLIVVLVIAGVLGAGLLTLGTGSAIAGMGYNAADQARHLARSGVMLAKTRLRAANQDKDTVLAAYTALDTALFSTADSTTFELAMARPVLRSGVARFPLITATSSVHAGGPFEARFTASTTDFSFTLIDPTGTEPGEEWQEVLFYGQELGFSGSSMYGDNATVVVKGNLDTDDISRGAYVGVSTIIVDGSVYLDGGNADLGSSTAPGAIYVNGDLTLWSGARNIYGDVYVNGDFYLKDARVHGNVYVNGSVELGTSVTMMEGAFVYYTGDLTAPANTKADVLDRFVKQETVPGFEVPSLTIPLTKPLEWYTGNGYSSDGLLQSNLRIYTQGDYVSDRLKTDVGNVVIVSEGDISITTLGGSGVEGLLFAPNGKVTFDGSSFSGIVISSGGFFVNNGSATVTFKGIADFFDDPEDYPFELEDPDL
jgi:hypothetical protein